MSVHDEIYAAVNKALDEGDTRVKELRGLLESRNETIRQLEESSIFERTNADDAIRKLESDLLFSQENASEIATRMETENRALSEQLAEKTKHVNELSLDVDGLNRSIESLKREAEKSAITITQLQRATRLLEDKLDRDTESLKAAHKEALDNRDLDIITLKRQFDAYIEKTGKEIEQLTASMESSIKESGNEVSYLTSANERLVAENKKAESEFAEKIRERDEAIARLTGNIDRLDEQTNTDIEKMRVKVSDLVAEHVKELDAVRAELQSVRASYQEGREITQKAWAALGYPSAYPSAPKPMHELILDKDAQIETLQKIRVSLKDDHTDMTLALKAEIEELKSRQMTMESTIARYRGIEDVSDMVLKMADAMERGQWSGSDPDDAKLIEEAREKVVAIK